MVLMAIDARTRMERVAQAQAFLVYLSCEMWRWDWHPSPYFG